MPLHRHCLTHNPSVGSLVGVSSRKQIVTHQAKTSIIEKLETLKAQIQVQSAQNRYASENLSQN